MAATDYQLNPQVAPPSPHNESRSSLSSSSTSLQGDGSSRTVRFAEVGKKSLATPVKSSDTSALAKDADKSIHTYTFQPSSLCDLQLYVTDKHTGKLYIYHVHKAILAARSKYFYSIINGDREISALNLNAGVVNQATNQQVFKDFLQSFYSSEVAHTVLKPSNMASLIQLYHQFDCDELVEISEKYVIDSLNHTRSADSPAYAAMWAQCIPVADVLKLNVMRTALIDFFAWHDGELRASINSVGGIEKFINIIGYRNFIEILKQKYETPNGSNPHE